MMISEDSVKQIAQIFAEILKIIIYIKVDLNLSTSLINILILMMSIKPVFRPDGRMYMIRLSNC